MRSCSDNLSPTQQPNLAMPRAAANLQLWRLPIAVRDSTTP